MGYISHRGALSLRLFSNRGWGVVDQLCRDDAVVRGECDRRDELDRAVPRTGARVVALGRLRGRESLLVEQEVVLGVQVALNKNLVSTRRFT